jgi:hypothetical protein
MASTNIFNVTPQHDVKKWVLEWSSTGRKIYFVFEGDRDALLELGNKIFDGDVTAGIATEGLEVALPDDSGDWLLRTPRLNNDNTGLITQLEAVAEEGMNEGDTLVSSDHASVFIPPDTTVRCVIEANDVELAYGYPFRPDMKWDLTKTFADLGIDTESIKDIFNGDAQPFSLLAAINKWESGTFKDVTQKDALYTFLIGVGNSYDEHPCNEYFVRYLRGQRTFRCWVPNVTVSQRWRTMPLSSNFPPPGGVGAVGDEDKSGKWLGPPTWTGAPTEDKWGNQYLYWRGATQVEFAGEVYTSETQWWGFFEFDQALYGDPNPTISGA